MTAQKDSQTEHTPKFHWNYHDKECTSAFVLIGPDGNDAMLATDDDAGQVYLMFQSPQMRQHILTALNSHAALKSKLARCVLTMEGASLTEDQQHIFESARNLLKSL